MFIELSGCGIDCQKTIDMQPGGGLSLLSVDVDCNICDLLFLDTVAYQQGIDCCVTAAESAIKLGGVFRSTLHEDVGAE